MGTESKRQFLSQTHPELVVEAMFDPTTITAGSPKKALWKCAAYGHQWEAQVKHRTAAFGTGCPVCCNPKILADFNDLQSTHPGIAQEANFDPTTVVDGTVLDRWYRTGLFFCLRVTTRSSRRRWEWAQELMMGLFTKKVNGYVLGPGATLGGKRW